MTLEFDEKQRQAIDACSKVSERLVGVTGKAGTGKTTIIANVHEQLTGAGYSVVCSAPTGKAARRIREATGLQAFTNHKLLGYGTPREYEERDAKGKVKVVKVSTGPRYGRSEPLAYDTLLCDEFMMVNEEIYSNLCDALKPGARICMFGDVNQLKPIEPGPINPKELCPFERTLQKFTNVTLDTIHRHDEGSGIAHNGAMILAGRIPQRADDFDLRFTDAPLQPLLEYVRRSAESGIMFDSTDHQILTCMNKTWIGTKRLNPAIQQIFWKPDFIGMDLPRKRAYRNEEPDPPIRVQVGSKVIFTANIYQINDSNDEVMNGECGIVTELDFDLGTVTIDFGDREVAIPPLIINVMPDGRTTELDPRTLIDLAYVLTTHKAQGSEYQHVCYVMNRSTGFAQSRRNLYTGVTRARKHCTLFTDQFSLVKSTRYAG